MVRLRISLKAFISFSIWKNVILHTLERSKAFKSMFAVKIYYYIKICFLIFKKHIFLRRSTSVFSFLKSSGKAVNKIIRINLYDSLYIADVVNSFNQFWKRFWKICFWGYWRSANCHSKRARVRKRRNHKYFLLTPGNV